MSAKGRRMSADRVDNRCLKEKKEGGVVGGVSAGCRRVRQADIGSVHFCSHVGMSFPQFLWLQGSKSFSKLCFLLSMSAQGSGEGDGSVIPCKLCSRVLPSTTNGRLHGKHWTCRHCLTMEQLLHRHLGPSDQQGWTVESKADFFKKAATESLQTGRHSWETVRTWIIEAQTVRETMEQENRVKSKALPLSVWEQKGYAKEDILKFPSEENVHLGTLYSVPVKSSSLREVKAKITEQVFNRERTARGGAQKRKASDAVGDGDAAEVWDVVTPQAPTSTGSKGAKAVKVEKESSGKALEKERAKQDKINDRTGTNAAKATGPLVRATKACKGLLAPAAKFGLGEDAIKSLKQAIDKGEGWNKEAVEVQSLVEKTKGTGAKVPELSFAPSDLKVFTKATNELLKDLRGRLKKEKDKAAAAAQEAALGEKK